MARPRRTAVSADTDRRLLQGVRGLVERNAELEAENRRLRQLVDDISRSLNVRADRPAPVDGTAPRRRGRPRKNPEAPVRERKKITDPAVLEKRRQALTKARAVRQERLAAARA
ncbi:MAG: hypothetical protein QOK05_566 [Chloroflexota bacterium]|jgi:hypothetical protein|nr:hypothetical protein [Chloroflexota bacterium]